MDEHTLAALAWTFVARVPSHDDGIETAAPGRRQRLRLLCRHYDSNRDATRDLDAPGVRGDLLEKLGRYAEARTEFERAATIATNNRERDLLLARVTRVLTPTGRVIRIQRRNEAVRTFVALRRD